MTNNLQLNAKVRTDEGKGASRRLRRTNNIPGIVYGGGKNPQSITLGHKDVMKALKIGGRLIPETARRLEISE